MTIHCENAHKAEITFSLPSGGKEGYLISFNPPVSLYIASGRLVNIKKFQSYNNGFIEYETVSTHVLISPKADEDFSYHFERFGEGVRLVKRSTDENGESYIIEVLWAVNNSFSDEIIQQHIMEAVKELNNTFIIEDTTGVIYSSEYPQGVIPQYNVNCFACNIKESPITGERDIVCIDIEKVINGLNRARNKLRNYGSK